jgi:hypothetical protein
MDGREAQKCRKHAARHERKLPMPSRCLVSGADLDGCARCHPDVLSDKTVESSLHLENIGLSGLFMRSFALYLMTAVIHCRLPNSAAFGMRLRSQAWDNHSRAPGTNGSCTSLISPLLARGLLACIEASRLMLNSQVIGVTGKPILRQATVIERASRVEHEH